MDRARKEDARRVVGELADAGAAVVVATHDAEFAASFAERGRAARRRRLIADGPAAEVLAGGWYFATETARILGGGGRSRRSAGAALLRALGWPPGARCDELAARRVALLGARARRAASPGTSARARRLAMVALVAALAALAVVGRLVFAPIPNVEATTDIVLLTGYALGGAPGFAVGALAALASNLWLGQGPWTPWQMAGWGLVGIGGAVLARVTRRRLGRGRRSRWRAASPASPTGRCSTSR